MDKKTNRKLREVQYFVPKDEKWSDRIIIDRRTKYFTVTDTAWDLIKFKIRDRYEDEATLICEEEDKLQVYLPLKKPQQKDEKPSD